MSQDVVRFVQEHIYANFEAGNVEGLMGALSDDIVWTHHGPRDRIPFAGTWKGKAGVGAFLQAFLGSAEPVFVNVKGMVASGDTVVVLIRESYRVRATGKAYETDVAHIWKIVGGKAVQFDELYDSAAIADAFTA